MGLKTAKVGLDLVRVGKPLAFDAADQARIKEYLARYPSDQRDSAIMPALWLAQKRFGFISEEAIELVAKSLEVSEADVAAVASFYTMYNLAPTGRHIVQVCCTLSCSLMGAERIVKHLEKKLGIGAGETTKDGKFTLKKVECLAACGMAPMLQINEERYHYNLTESEVDRILDSLS